MGLLLLNGESGLNPRTLFANNEQGLWLDPSQLSTLYQDSNGVTPCTAAGDPVGLVLDQSRGGLSQIGAELVTNGGFDSGSSWTIAGGTPPTISGGTANWSAATGSITSSSSIVSGKWYRLTFDLVSYTSGTLAFRDGTTNTTIATTGAVAGSKSFIILATGTNIAFHSFSAATLTIDNISIREVPGNHAFQTTSASRPTLARIPSSGRRNLLTYSEDISNAVWGKMLTTITGTDTIVLSAGSASKYILYSITGTAPSTISFEAKAGTHRYIQVLSSSDSQHFVNIDLTDGVIGTAGTKAEGSVVQDLGDGWRRYRVTITTTGFSSIRFYAADSTSSVYGVSTNSTESWQIRKIQLETGSTATNYQKVVATTDVTESGVGDLWHLVFDGSDDSLTTAASVDFSGTDEMTVIAGVRKLNDTGGLVVESSTSSATNTGTFALTSASLAGNEGDAFYRSRGDGDASGLYAATPAAPLSYVQTLQGDISGAVFEDELFGRFNGAAVTLQKTNSGPAGTGNFGNYPIYIGRRGGSSLPFNGHLYQLIIRGRTTPTGKLLEAERFTARKTGLSI